MVLWTGLGWLTLFHVASVEIPEWYLAGIWTTLKGPIQRYYLSGALVGVITRLGSAVVVHHVYTRPFQPGSFSVVRLLTWQLGAPRAGVPAKKAKAAASFLT